MKSRILFFVGASYVAGLEIVTLELLKELKKQGFEIKCVICGWNDGDFKSRLKQNNIEFEEVKLGWLHLRKPLWTIDTLLHYPAAFFKCRSIIKHYKADILHFTNYTMAVMLYPLLKGNIIYTVHETHLPVLKHKMIYKWLNKKINYFTAVSGHIATTLLNLGVAEDKIKLIYNGVAIPKNIAEVLDYTNESAKINFSIVGQVGQWKGHETLIDAVEQLILHGECKFRVLIFGKADNPFGKRMKERITEKNMDQYFIWKGFFKDQDKIYSETDVLIVPSIFEEPFSLVTAEAMVRKKSVIVAFRGGLKELVSNNENGLVFESGNSYDLSNCMKEILQNSQKRHYMVEKAYGKAIMNFTVPAMTGKFILLYQNIKLIVKK